MRLLVLLLTIAILAIAGKIMHFMGWQFALGMAVATALWICYWRSENGYWPGDPKPEPKVEILPPEAN